MHFYGWINSSNNLKQNIMSFKNYDVIMRFVRFVNFCWIIFLIKIKSHIKYVNNVKKDLNSNFYLFKDVLCLFEDVIFYVKHDNL